MTDNSTTTPEASFETTAPSVDADHDQAVDIELPDDIGGWLTLGDDSDCESCGWSSNQVEWNLDGGEIRLTASIGCYGGEYLQTTDLDEAGAFIRQIANRFSIQKRDVTATITEMRERVTAHREKAA